jgi:hypothetical protein
MSLTAVTDTQYQYIGDRGTDGTIIGYNSSGPLGFFGATPVARQTAPTAAATTVAVSTTTGAITSWGFAGSTQANAITTAISDIITVLTNLGLVA